MQTTVHDITTAIALGQSEAFALFYRAWFDRILADVRACGGSRARDEQFCLDVVQDVMMRVIRSIKTMDSEAALQAWLRTVAKSCCIDHLRREQRRHKREHACCVPDDQAGGEPQPRTQIMWLNEQLQKLSPDDADLLTLRYRMGWTLQRIGQALGLKAGAVDGRISRALALLRRQAPEDFHEP